MTPDDMLTHVLSICEAYDPLSECDKNSAEWHDADPYDKEISMVVRALAHEINTEFHELTGKRCH